MAPVVGVVSGGTHRPACRYEVLQGRPLALPEPGTAHQDVVGALYLALRAWAQPTHAGRVLLSPLILRLGDGDELQPDLCFVRTGGRALIQAEGVAGTPDLVLEVLAPATAERDRVLKRAIYERHGLPEYWIADPEAGTVQVLTRGGDGLQPRRTLAYGAILAAELVPSGFGPSSAQLLTGPSGALRPPRPVWRYPGLPWRRLPPPGSGADGGDRPAPAPAAAAAPTGPSWERLSAEFLEAGRRSGWRPATLSGHARDLEVFARWYRALPGAGQLDPATVTAQELLAFRSWLAARYRPGTANRRLTTVRWLFELARAQGHVRRSPAARMRSLPEMNLGPRSLRREEVSRLVAAAERRSPRNAALMVLILNTGLQLREALGLSWADVTLGERAGRLWVRRGRGGIRHELPLNATACMCLRRWRAACGLGDPPPQAAVFAGPGGRLPSPKTVQTSFRGYSRRAGLEPTASPTTLRHTFCRMLLDRGVSLDRVRALAGHAWLATTARYTLPTAADLARDVNLLDWS